MDASLVYLGHDNPVARELLLDGVPMALTEVTRVTLQLKSGVTSVLLDSQQVPVLFDWTSRPAVVQVRAGLVSNLSAGRWTATLVIYGPAYAQGLVVPPFAVDVRTA